ncbi:MAG: transcription termination/antitermination protein NusA [Firmicutes bacterium]|nr:transcription termination/antitermination protein NusA [Bacillota bacterium]HOB34500.1 transcription termination factor NusA [Bacillota bacterium]HPZ90108.1 transcription termination factor NusA [Bacillota bacterium]HQE01054.1 transcription termination factor NusA [Bacillota bacterium]
MDVAEFIEAVQQLEEEKGIPKEVLFEAVEAALVSAYKKNFCSLQNVRVELNQQTGAIKVFSQKKVVEKVENPMEEISLRDALKLSPIYTIGDLAEVEVTPKNFGRIAAQAAKQVVIQKIREAEREKIYEEFANRESEVVTGIIQSVEQGNVFVDIGKVEAVLPPSEQLEGDKYEPQTRLKVYVLEVKNSPKGPQVFASRTHPGLIKRLFEAEVPEIYDGVVEIKAVSREAGQRSKIAVWSDNPDVDPVGACVGPRGMRVQAIVNELRGEKIDIVRWSADPAEFVANALSPAKVTRVEVDEEQKIASIVVPDNQLSLAIGKEGQNARLAAKLTGWKIDIKSESQSAEEAGDES